MLRWRTLSGDPTTFDLEGVQVGRVRSVLLDRGLLLVVVALVASVVAMMIRLRRSDGVERQQLRLVAVGPMLVLLGLVVLIVGQTSNGGRQTYATAVPLYLAYLSLPVLFALAVLRYRLHDVDVIINAAVLVAVGTAFAAVGYVAVVVVVGDEVDSRAGGWILSLAGTVLVALAFQPLRRGVVHLANRLAYGPRARPYVALSDFSSRLVESPLPHTLLPAVADAAGRAVSAQGAIVTLDVPGAGMLRRPGETDRERGRRTTCPCAAVAALGGITVLVPAGAMRPADARLLQALADQTAMAFRNTALATELTQRVEQLDRTTQQLSQSRARLVDASDDVRRTLEAAISRQVLPRLWTSRALASTWPSLGPPPRLSHPDARGHEPRAGVAPGADPRRLPDPAVPGRPRSGPAVAAWCRVGVGLGWSRTPRRSGDSPPRVEMAMYFCCAEAAPALSDRSTVRLSADERGLWLHLSGVAVERVDLQAVADRVAAAAGP